MSTKKTISPEIQKLKLSEIVVDISLSGRNQKEIAANAKSLAPAIAAFGAWDASQPGQFFERDGKKHLAAGFTRHAASLIAGLKDGFFVEVEDDAAKIRTTAIRTNMGRPISQYEQGRIYAAMRDGSKAEDMKVGEVAMSPMKPSEIADEVGYTPQHVANCLVIFESTPEIGELVTEGKVSSGIVITAKQLVKDDAKRLAFLRAAVAEAKKNGSECATKKHLDAVREKYAPLKAKKTPDKNTPPATTGSAEESAQEEGTQESESKERTSQPSLESLGSSDAPLIPKTTTKPAKTPTGGATRVTKEQFVGVIGKWGEDHNVIFSDEDLDDLIEKLIALTVPF